MTLVTWAETAVLGVVPHGMWQTLLQVLVLLALAMLLGAAAEWLRQSALVGYLLAGAILGPGGAAWVTSQQEIFDIAELGVALLLFAIGLEFSPQSLLTLGRVPLIAGPLQVAITMVAGAAACLGFGYSPRAAVVMGALLSLSSTASALRLLTDRAEVDTPYGRTSLGILLIQDVAVVPLVLLVTIMVRGGSVATMVTRLSLSLLLAAVLIGVFYVLFSRVTPRLLTLRTWRLNRDLPVLLAVVMALGSAWSAQSLGLSPALGAFVAGVLLAVSPFAVQIRADIQPIKTVLVTLFFASVGMFADVRWLYEHLGLVLAIAATIVVGKGSLTALTVWLAGQSAQFAVAAGLCLAQVGEFSFVLAVIARGDAAATGLLSEETFLGFVSATILTLFATPYLIVAAPLVGGYVHRRLGRWATRRGASEPAAEAAESRQEPEPGETHPIVIVGFGPAGQRAAEDLMARHHRQLVVIDLNHENVVVAERYGLEAHIGDATQTEILEHAGVQRAAVVLVTIPTPTAARHLVDLVRHLAPHAVLIVRSRYHIHRWQLLQAGADIVVDEEDHVGHRLALEVATALGESPPEA